MFRYGAPRLRTHCSSSPADAGVSMLELVLGLPFLCLIVAGLIDLGISLRYVEVISNAARHSALTAAAVAADAPTTCEVLQTQALGFATDYLVQSGLDPADWAIGPNLDPPGPSVITYKVDEGTPNEVVGQAMRVTIQGVEDSEGCVLCWEYFFPRLRVDAEGLFALQGSCAW